MHRRMAVVAVKKDVAQEKGAAGKKETKVTKPVKSIVKVEEKEEGWWR